MPALQEATIRKIRIAKGQAFVVRSVDEVRAVLTVPCNEQRR